MTRRLEDRIAAVRAALESRDEAPSRKVCVDALRRGPGALVAVVADALGDGDRELLDRLPEAFARLSDDPVKRDPGCAGKAAIVRALYRTDARDDAVFLAGARLVQSEPVWGGRVDTAAELRGVCGMALAAMGHAAAMNVLAGLLADPERATRVGAARALAGAGDRVAAEALLRLRLQIGEPDPEALAEELTALLELAGDDAIAFVAERLDSRDDDVVEVAALALGGSRRPAALTELTRRLEEGALGARRRTLSLAVALLRTETAWAFLLARIIDADEGDAEDALRALATFAHDDKLHARVLEALTDRDDEDLAALARTLWTEP